MVKLHHNQNGDNLTWFGCRITEPPLDDLEQNCTNGTRRTIYRVDPENSKLQYEWRDHIIQ